MQEIKEIVLRYKKRETPEIPYNVITREISEVLGPGLEIDRETVAAWGQGKNKPNKYMLVLLVMRAPGPLAEMAQEILTVMNPEVWG